MDAVLEIISYIWWVLLAIMILVFVHEMGHFLFAKLFKMRVDRFSIGFPPKILGRKVGETEYVIGATPLGGYVKIAGMVDESMDAGYAHSEPQPWEFRSKPVWQRIIVITAGVIFNILLAIGIFASLKLAYGEDYIPAENVESVYVAEGSIAHEMGLRTGDRIVAWGGRELEQYGDFAQIEALATNPQITVERKGERITLDGPRDIMTRLSRAEGDFGVSAEPSLIGGVAEGSAADRAGIQAGDRIIAIGGHPVRFWYEMTEQIQQAGDQPVTIQWERPDTVAASGALASNRVDVPAGGDSLAGVQIREATVELTFDEQTGRYLLGVGSPTGDMLAEEFGVRHKEYGFGEALASGTAATWRTTNLIVTSLKRIVTLEDDPRENLGGIVAVAQATKQAADAGSQAFWNTLALLSISLAIMNILPIPALDGGHLIFLIYEGITRREPSLKVRMALQQVGMVVLLALMVFLLFNDVLRFSRG